MLLRLRHALEYLLLRGSLAVLDRVPYGAATWLACRLADLWWLVDRSRRRVAVENILRAQIETDRPRARALGRRSFQHFALVIIESLRSEELLEQVAVEISPDVAAVLETPDQGLILTSGHFGNWELAAQLLSRYKPVAGITRPMNNPWVEKLVQRRKPRHRFHPIPKYAADPRRFLAVLEAGEILALLTDQHARQGGIELEFFGVPAATYTTAAMLHLVTRQPLCFGACRRVGPGRFELHTSPLIELERSGDKKQDQRALLSVLNRYLETEIRSAPEQYLWGHRRWRL